jgi:hypothetical protein
MENWMQNELESIAFETSIFENVVDYKVYSGLLNVFYMKFFSRLIFRKPFWQLYLHYKGLTLEKAKQY